MDAVSDDRTFRPDDVTMPHCPHCGRELALGSSGTVDHWSCPELHGLAMTLSESHGRLQPDEISKLWQSARTGDAGPLPSPFDGRPMVRVQLTFDDDELAEGADGDTPDRGTVELDVDIENQFIWFDTGELEELPADREDAPPSPEEEAALARISRQFSRDIGEALEERDDDEWSERVYQHIARRPGLTHTLDRIGHAVTTY